MIGNLLKIRNKIWQQSLTMYISISIFKEDIEHWWRDFFITWNFLPNINYGIWKVALNNMGYFSTIWFCCLFSGATSLSELTTDVSARCWTFRILSMSCIIYCCSAPYGTSVNWKIKNMHGRFDILGTFGYIWYLGTLVLQTCYLGYLEHAQTNSFKNWGINSELSWSSICIQKIKTIQRITPERSQICYLEYFGHVQACLTTPT